MVLAAAASFCTVSGPGASTAMVRQTAQFTIEAKDERGTPCTQGGEVFSVSVRGASLVKARVADNDDGTYLVEYKPSVSGRYTISITLGGQLLSGSPFGLNVLTPQPDPTRCVLRGEALTNAKARENASFEIEFIDALGQARAPPPAAAPPARLALARVPARPLLLNGCERVYRSSPRI